MDNRCLHRYYQIIFRHMFRIMYENIEELSVEFACKVLDNVDNPSDCNDSLDAVFVYERMVMMNCKDCQHLLLNERSIDSNWAMKLSGQLIMMHVSTVDQTSAAFSVVAAELNAVEIEGYA